MSLCHATRQDASPPTGDVQVDPEVQQAVDAVIEEGVQALNHQDLGGLDALGGVDQTGDVVVDGLVHSLALLQGLDLRGGGRGIEGCERGLLTAVHLLQQNLQLLLIHYGPAQPLQ